MALRREPYLRSENLLQYALDELARLKGTKTRTTDGRNLVILPPGSAPPGGGTVPAPVEAGPHVLYGSKHTNSLHVTAGAGLNADYEGSQVWIAGAFYVIAAGSLAMTNAATNYVFVNDAGAVASNTTGFPAVCLPMATVVTAGGAITLVNDRRAYLSDTASGGGLSNPVDILQIDDVNFNLDIVAANPRITFDTGDFIEYNRATNTFVLDVGSVDKFAYIGGATDEFRYNAVARYTEPAVLSGTVVLDTRDAGAGAVARMDIISEDAIAGVDWYRKSATDTRIKFAFELEGIVAQDPDLVMYRFTGAGGAEAKDEVFRFINATGVTQVDILSVLGLATVGTTLGVGDALTIGPSDFGMLAHLVLQPGSGANRVGVTSGTGRLGVFVGDPAGVNFEALSILHTNGYVGILNSSPQQPLDVTGVIRTSAGLEVMNQNLLKLYDAGSSNYIGLKADAARTTDLVYILPASDPTVNQVLVASAPVAGVVTLSWGSGGAGGYTDEEAQDAVGTILLDTTEIDFTYTDATPSIEASIKANSVVVGRVHFTDTALLLGRSTAAAGAGEEISIGSGLDLSAGVLSATGGVGAASWGRTFLMMGA